MNQNFTFISLQSTFISNKLGIIVWKSEIIAEKRDDKVCEL